MAQAAVTKPIDHKPSRMLTTPTADLPKRVEFTLPVKAKLAPFLSGEKIYGRMVVAFTFGVEPSVSLFL